MYNQIKLTGYAVILYQQGYVDFRLCPTKSGAESYARYFADHYYNAKIYLCRAENMLIAPRYEFHERNNDEQKKKNENG